MHKATRPPAPRQERGFEFHSGRFRADDLRALLIAHRDERCDCGLTLLQHGRWPFYGPALIDDHIFGQCEER